VKVQNKTNISPDIDQSYNPTFILPLTMLVCQMENLSVCWIVLWSFTRQWNP